MRRSAVGPNHHHSSSVRHPPAVDTTDSTKPRDAHTRGKLCTSVWRENGSTSLSLIQYQLTKCKSFSVADPGFPERGHQPQSGALTYYLASFAQSSNNAWKWQKITLRGRPSRLLDPPLVVQFRRFFLSFANRFLLFLWLVDIVTWCARERPRWFDGHDVVALRGEGGSQWDGRRGRVLPNDQPPRLER